MLETTVNPTINDLDETLSSAILPSSATDLPDGSSTQSVAFVDSGLADVDNLIASLTDTTVYLIDANTDGVSVINDALLQLQDSGNTIDSVHIFTHGDAGALQLGSTTLTADNLIGFSDELASWGESTTRDVLLYGCDVAKGETGNAFIDQLAALTGADIQASNDITGNALLGGDWDLEVSTGSIESAFAISEAGQASYLGTLAAPRILTNGGGDTATVVVDNGSSFITDVNVEGANGFQEGAGIEYYFSGGNDSYLFDIDVNTGVVSFRGEFDFNNPTDANRDNIYDINILAIDWTQQNDQQAMQIRVNPPGDRFEITNDENLSISEGSTTVTDFNVRGAGGGFSEGNGVEYYLYGGNDSYLFDLNQDSGVLSFQNAPNFDNPVDANRDNNYDVGIIAIDYTGQQDIQSFNVEVEDGSGSTGGGQFRITNARNFNVDEGTTAVTDFNVRGAGGGFSEGNGVEYYFFGGNDSYLFDLNRDSGVLSFRDAPNFDNPVDANRDNNYDVGIVAVDYTGQQDIQSYAVRVRDAGGSPGGGTPRITSNGGNDTAVINLNEGNTAVTDVNVAGGENGLTYSLNAGDDADLFNINQNTGVISFKNAPDFENPADANQDNVYFANVLVQNNRGQADSQFLSVVVQDIAEGGSAPVITSNGGNESAFVQVQENNTLAVDLSVTDADGETEGNGITYRINAGEDRDLFNINANTGEISFRNAADFENALDSDRNNIYRINVLATDSTGRADSQFIQIEVTNEVSVYLLGGQSNIAGDTSDRTFLNGRPEGSPLSDVQIWSQGTNSYIDLQPGFNGNFGGQSGFGAEIGFGHRLAAAQANGQVEGEEIYLIKYAVGATSLDVDWNVNGNGNVYDDFTEWVGGALENLTNAGIGYDIEGMLWMQGENDSFDAGRAARYQNNLDTLIGDVRSRYGQDMDFVIGRLHEELTPFFYSEADTVRAAQANVANSNSRNSLVNTDDLPVNTDGVHFTSAGHLRLGQKFADAFIS